jgi:hypothetical protein
MPYSEDDKIKQKKNVLKQLMDAMGGMNHERFMKMKKSDPNSVVRESEIIGMIGAPKMAPKTRPVADETGWITDEPVTEEVTMAGETLQGIDPRLAAIIKKKREEEMA